MGIKADFLRVDLASFSSSALLGSWINELGSKMTVQHASGDTFSGVYESAVSEGEEPVSGKLEGALAGDCIGYTVNWKPAFSSVTCFTGKVFTDNAGVLHIYTLWQLSRGVEDDKDFWQSFLTGSDLFTKTA